MFQCSLNHRLIMSFLQERMSSLKHDFHYMISSHSSIVLYSSMTLTETGMTWQINYDYGLMKIYYIFINHYLSLIIINCLYKKKLSIHYILSVINLSCTIGWPAPVTVLIKRLEVSWTKIARNLLDISHIWSRDLMHTSWNFD